VAGHAFQNAFVPFDRTPGVSRLFLDYTEQWPKIASFYDHPYEIDRIAAFSRECARPAPSALERLCEALSAQQDRWGASRRGVEKLRAGAVAVLTGQQPGLFTGPLYGVLKAITAIKLARALEERGVPAIPVFWIASEDHDQEEIRWAAVLDREGAPRRFQVDLAGDEAAPAGWTRYADTIQTVVAQLFECLPESEFIPEIREMVEAAYVPGASPVDAFGRMVTRLFADSGLTPVDPLDPALKRLAEPALEEAVRRNDDIRAAVLRQNQALVEAGYHEQVRVGPDFTGLFTYEGGARRVLKPNQLASGLRLSPNVLLRPMTQDTIFPTVAYVGGPAEIAYFGQAVAVYRALGRSMPPVFPRIGATLVEARVARAFEAYGLEPSDAWQGRDFLAKKAGQTLAGAAAFDRVHDEVSATLESLRPTLAPVDPTLLGALDTSRQKMLHQVEALRTKYLHAEARRNQVMDRRLDTISHALYPDKKLQEREISVLSFVARYGMGAIGRITDRLSLDVRQHQFIGIE
jgi:uncharacterized protein YllA (UPF0747 family)